MGPNDLDRKVRELLDLPEESLLEILGAEVQPPSLGFGVDVAKAIESARQWLARHRSVIQLKVCSSHVARICRDNPKAFDRVILVAAIADLIAAVCVGVSPIVVAVLIVKAGVTELCPG
jgi:hypothetical protein